MHDQTEFIDQSRANELSCKIGAADLELTVNVLIDSCEFTPNASAQEPGIVAD